MRISASLALLAFTAEAQGLPVCTGACVGTWRPALASTASGLPKHVARPISVVNYIV